MIIKREILEAAASAGMLKYGQIDNLFVFLAQQELKSGQQAGSTRFNATLLYYLGGVLVLSAALLLAMVAINSIGMHALLWFSVVYGVCAVGIASWCARRGFGFAGSLFALMAIALVGSAVFAAQALQGDWTGGLEALLVNQVTMAIDQRLLVIELTALATGVALMLGLRLPFLLLPNAFIAWLVGIDAVPSLLMQFNSIASLGMTSSVDELRYAFTLAVGVTLIMLGLSIDLRRRADDAGFAFWAYVAGLLALSWAVFFLTNDMMLGKLTYFAMHCGLIAFGVVLGRRVFEVFGGGGIALLVGELILATYKDSSVLVPALTMASLVMLAMAVWWWRRAPHIGARLRQWLRGDLKSVAGARAA
jgi:hypothetical protein